MMRSTPLAVSTSLEQVVARIRRATFDQIRDLVVAEEGGRIVVQGLAPSQHCRQLALQGLLEVLSRDRLSTRIKVG